MHGDGGELNHREQKHAQRSTPHAKKHKNRPNERRHSFKHAVVQQPELDSTMNAKYVWQNGSWIGVVFDFSCVRFSY